ncbi:MAG: rod shape-determining protein MreC [Planctomycetota bacterium]
MPRFGAQLATQQRVLGAGIVVMLVLGLLPVRWMGWAAWLSEPVIRLVAPVSGPIGSAARWLTRPDRADLDERDVRGLIADRDLAEQRFLREREINAELRRQIDDLNAAIALNPNLAARQVTAPVIARSSDPSSSVLTVRAGADLGVHTLDVATVRGVQLLGRVERATGSTSYITPITDRAGAGKRFITGAIMLDDDRTLGCLLTPTSDGALVGDVQDERGPDGQPIGIPEPGQTVRLRDLDGWPAHAQMLVLGAIERVEPKPDQPLRNRITVRPTTDLARVSEVIIRTTEAQASDEAGESAAERNQ